MIREGNFCTRSVVADKLPGYQAERSLCTSDRYASTPGYVTAHQRLSVRSSVYSENRSIGDAGGQYLLNMVECKRGLALNVVVPAIL